MVAPATESRYLTSVSRFLAFVRFHGFHREVSHFIESLWEEGDPKSWASVSGLGHFIPAVKPHLLASWRLHSAWTRAELPARAPPLTALLVYALAQLAFDRRWPDTAVLIVLGFHTFARSGELFAARVGDFVLQKGTGAWSLPLTKSGQRAGASESILLTDRFVVSCLPFRRHHFAVPASAMDARQLTHFGILNENGFADFDLLLRNRERLTRRIFHPTHQHAGSMCSMSLLARRPPPRRPFSEGHFVGSQALLWLALGETHCTRLFLSPWGASRVKMCCSSIFLALYSWLGFMRTKV